MHTGALLATVDAVTSGTPASARPFPQLAKGPSEHQWFALDVAAALVAFVAATLEIRSAAGPHGPDRARTCAWAG
ncbi:MAG TPA: hypothetical protein VME46_06545 [Acidimicrobiales bacterium]|nr:hypothetical protein [Acidimicrobiales bacterium]